MSPIKHLCLLILVVCKTRAYVDHDLCGLSTVDNTRIFRGSAVTPGELPWVANLYLSSNSWWNDVYETCTAGILNERWILTAAHCVNKHEGYFVDITFGRVDIRDPSSGGKVTIKKLRRNYNYFYSSGFESNINKDIALLLLRERNEISTLPDRVEEIEHVNRMCLIPNPIFGYENWQPVVIGGYGLLNKTNLNGNVMWRLDAVTAYNEFDIELGFDKRLNFAFTNDSILVPKACTGDSGAPITFYQKSQTSDPALANMTRAVTVGVLSRGKGECEAIPKDGYIHAYTVGVRVDWALSWIDNIMSQVCNAEVPASYQSSKLSRYNLCTVL